MEFLKKEYKNTVPNNGFVQWLGLGFSFGKTSMSRKVVLYLLWSVLNPCGFR